MKLSMKQCQAINRVLTAINKWDDVYSFETGRIHYIAKIDISHYMEADCKQAVTIYVHSDFIEFYSSSYNKELFEVLDSNKSVYLKDDIFHSGKARWLHGTTADGLSNYKAYTKVDATASADEIAQAILSTANVAYGITRMFYGHSKDKIKKFLDGRVES